MTDKATTLRNLKEARFLLKEPSAWIQGAYARRKDGTLVKHYDYVVRSECECFCIIGALLAVCSGSGPHAAVHALRRFATGELGSHDDLPTINDRPTTVHEDVLDLFDGTIALLEEELSRPVAAKNP